MSRRLFPVPPCTCRVVRTRLSGTTAHWRQHQWATRFTSYKTGNYSRHSAARTVALMHDDPFEIRVEIHFTKRKKQAVREAATICPRPLQVDLWPFDLESGVRVTCDVGYLYANFSLPRSLCFRLRPDVRDRQTQTSDTHHRVMPSPYEGGGQWGERILKLYAK